MVLFLALALQTSTVEIDPAAAYPWEGWGTSLCWMGKVFGDREDIADLLFTRKTVEINGERLPGLGLNIVRYNAGACSWNEVEGRKMVVSKNIPPYRQMEGFWLNPVSNLWDWELDAHQRAMLLMAKKRRANRFELFSNSPMWWMCQNDNPSGAAKSTQDNLIPDQTDAFTNYLAEIARHAKEKWGIRFTTIEPFNEPASSWWDEKCRQEGCHFSAATQADILIRLRLALDARGLKSLPIAASDETHVSHAVQTWKSFSPKVRALVSQVNVHGYEGLKSPRGELRKAIGDQRLWLSEHGENDASGMMLARSLLLDMHELRPTAWCYWQPLDGGGWGLVDADLPHARVLKSNLKFFVMAQFARHIRPGMRIVKSSDPDSVAAYDSKGRKLVVVLANAGSEIKRSIGLGACGCVRGSISVWITNKVAQYQRSKLRITDSGRFDITLTSYSVTTLEIPITATSDSKDGGR